MKQMHFLCLASTAREPKKEGARHEAVRSGLRYPALQIGGVSSLLVLIQTDGPKQMQTVNKKFISVVLFIC